LSELSARTVERRARHLDTRRRFEPYQQLRLRLELSKRQRVPWDTAWEAGKRGLSWTNGDEKLLYSEIWASQEAAWRAAYLDEPAPSSVARLLGLVDGLVDRSRSAGEPPPGSGCSGPEYAKAGKQAQRAA